MTARAIPLFYGHHHLAGGTFVRIYQSQHFVGRVYCRSVMLAFLSLILSSAYAAAKAPEAQNRSYTTIEGFPVNVYLAARDADTSTSKLTFTILRQPSHGTLAPRFSGSQNHLTYTPAKGFSGDDSFTWKANDGQYDSNIATVTITVTKNATPVAWSYRYDCEINMRTLYKLRDFSTDDEDGCQIIIVDKPANGTVEPELLGGAGGFYYTPANDFQGRDQFTFRVQDACGALSAQRTMFIDVRDFAWPDKPVVQIICEKADFISYARVLRWCDDLRREGWQPRIQVYTPGTGADWIDYWQYLASLYEAAPDTRGVVALGDLPIGPHTKGTDPGHHVGGTMFFWRLPPPDVRNVPYIKRNDPAPWFHYMGSHRIHMFYSQMKINWLDANHRYRTGQTRLPAKYYFGVYDSDKTEADPNLENVFGQFCKLTSRTGEAARAYREGGAFKYYSHHSGGGQDYYNQHCQILFNGTCGCDVSPGRMMWAFSRLHSATVLSGHHLGSHCPGDGIHRLSSRWQPGWCMGRLWLDARSAGYYIYGDLTLKAPRDYAPANAMPIIDLKADTQQVQAGDTVGFTATVTDPDADSSDNPQFNGEYQVEWRMQTNGTRFPQSMKASGQEHGATTVFTTKKQTQTFAHAKWYEVRVDARDEWNAWTCEHVLVGVRPDLRTGLRVNCGLQSDYADPSKDRYDSKGRMWQHEQSKPRILFPAQDWQLGQSWYCASAKKECEKKSAGSVAGTQDDVLYYTAARNFREHNRIFRVPASGKLLVRLGFADMWSTKASERVCDIQLEGATVLRSFDVYATVGPRTAVVKEFEVQVTDGMLDITLCRGRGGGWLTA